MPRAHNEWHDEARRMRAEGIGRRAIAKHFGISLYSVHYLLSERVRESARQRYIKQRDAQRASRDAHTRAA